MSPPQLIELPTDALALEQGCYLDFSLPEAFERFCEKYCTILSDDFHGKAGRPLKLLEWQRSVAYTQLGWRRADGTLRYKTIYIFIPKRQGKSLYCSALALFMALRSNRSEVVLLGPSKEQSKKVIYSRIAEIVENNTTLDKLLNCNPSNMTITGKTDRKMSISVIPTDTKSGAQSGFGLNLVIWDEFSSAPKHCARLVNDRLMSSGRDKVDSQKIYITTPEYDLGSLAFEVFQLCRKIENNECADIFTLPVIYSAPDNWRDDIENAVRIACPAVDQTVSLQSYLDDWQTKQGNPMLEAQFETFDLGRWVGSPEIFIPRATIETCWTDIPLSHWKGHRIIVSADYACRYDLCATTVTVEADGTFYTYPTAFLPRAVAEEKSLAGEAPYTSWEKMPSCNIVLTDGNTVDPQCLIDQIVALSKDYKIEKFLYDPNGLEHTRQRIAQLGIRTVEVNPKPHSMGACYRYLDLLAREGKIKFPNDPCLMWCFGNCKPVKGINSSDFRLERSAESNKIDEVTAIGISLAHWLEPQAQAPPPNAKYIEIF